MTYRDLFNILRQDPSKLDQEIKFIGNDDILGKARPVRAIEYADSSMSDFGVEFGELFLSEV